MCPSLLIAPTQPTLRTPSFSSVAAEDITKSSALAVENGDGAVAVAAEYLYTATDSSQQLKGFGDGAASGLLQDEEAVGKRGDGGYVLEPGVDGGVGGGVVIDDGKSATVSVYTMMGLCFLIAIVCALDRVAMSVAIVPMGLKYDYTDTTKGLVSLLVVRSSILYQTR